MEVPDEDVPAEGSEVQDTNVSVKESIKVQSLVAEIGVKMGYHVWVPRNDKQQVMSQMSSDLHKRFLDLLPLNYNDATLKPVEQIDVLWLNGRAIARAFEIEHTTAIYSGLLRMADLLALQPNMNIRSHIVAPEERREQVLREIKRPVFSLLESGPLYQQCTYLSYEPITDLAKNPNLTHMNDSIIGTIEESTEV